MSNISQLGSSIGRYQNRSELGEFGALSERKEALQASQSKSLELALTTKEGDTVTLSAGSFMEFASLSYDKSGRISNANTNTSAQISSREMTLASGSQFTFSVKGSLSEQEMDDIENIVKTLDEVINKMANGDIDDAMSKAMEMDEGYDSISEFEADLTYSSSYSFAAEQSESSYYSESEDQSELEGNRRKLLNRDGQDNQGILTSALNQLSQDDENEVQSVPKDSSSRLMEMMLKEFEKLREQNQDVTRKAAEPVDQLFAHHIDQLKKLGEIDGKKNSLNESQSNNQDDMVSPNLNLNPNNTEEKKLEEKALEEKALEEKALKEDKKGNLLEELANARKGMVEEFKKMLPEAQDFRKIASSFFDSMA